MPKVMETFKFTGSVTPWRLQLPFEAEEDGEPIKVYQVFDAGGSLLAQIKPAPVSGWVTHNEIQANMRAMGSAGQMATMLSDIMNHYQLSDEIIPEDLQDRVKALIHHINFHA